MKEAVRLRIAKKITNVSKTNSILFLSEKKKNGIKKKKRNIDVKIQPQLGKISISVNGRKQREH